MSKPIIFSTEMVKAILEGRKTQTRRVIIPQPEWKEKNGLWSAGWSWIKKDKSCGYGSYPIEAFKIVMTPNGQYQVGDVLYVRESMYCNKKGGFGRYKADESPVGGELPLLWAWKTNYLSARFMPKHLARIFLEVTNVRVERIRDISMQDRIAEGFDSDEELSNVHNLIAFGEYWNNLNSKRGYGWDVNPWVWVYEFKRVPEAKENP